MIASLKVAGFDDWKPAFDLPANDRAEARIHAKAYRNIDDANNGIGIVTAPSKKVVMAFFIAPEKNKKL